MKTPTEAGKKTGMSRRCMLTGAAAFAGALHSTGAVHAASRTVIRSPAPPAKLNVALFSKHVQFLDVREAAAAAKDMGFDGIDLTVRPDGHVLPANVATDLPKAVDLIRKAGLDVPMITTEITPDALPVAHSILTTASRLGIRKYRWGGLKYDMTKSIEEQLQALRPKIRALTELNHRTQTCGMYHTHSGPGLIGATIWDVYELFKDLDPALMGVNYDIGHATIEGGYGGWLATSRLTKGMMRGIALKDFVWARNEKGSTHPDPYDKSLGVPGAWVPHWCPIDQGMVRFGTFFDIVKENDFDGPLQLHIEYPLGGSENGKRTLTLPRDTVLNSIHSDLTAVRSHLTKAGLA